MELRAAAEPGFQGGGQRRGAPPSAVEAQEALESLLIADALPRTTRFSSSSAWRWGAGSHVADRVPDHAPIQAGSNAEMVEHRKKR